MRRLVAVLTVTVLSGRTARADLLGEHHKQAAGAPGGALRQDVVAEPEPGAATHEREDDVDDEAAGRSLRPVG
jgi:hypothetical protein